MHNLATTNEKPALAYFGEVPWHRLGTRLDAPATAEEAIVTAGLDYQVELNPLVTTDGIPVTQRRAVVRTDSQVVLGVVGNGYVPVQNRQAFAFLDAVVGDSGLRYHTAGALGQGERVWLLAKLPGHIRVKNSNDTTDKYLLLSNSHDGGSALRVFFTPIRVVCQNTLSIADRQSKGQGVAIRHKGDLAVKVREAQVVLGLAKRFYDDLEGMIDRLASHHPTSAQLEAYFKALYPDAEDRESTKAKKARQELLAVFETGIGHDMPQVRHTAWAAVNAVTEYVDHHRQTRGNSNTDRLSRRLESIWFGSGARLKEKAFDLALGMVSDN